ncbi:MAG: hypothetical protein ACLUD2_13310 [Clostridium sp.]
MPDGTGWSWRNLRMQIQALIKRRPTSSSRLEEGANNNSDRLCATWNGTMNVGEYPVSLYSGQDPDDADEKTQKTESEYRYSRQ